jgi:hypothetical protein
MTWYNPLSWFPAPKALTAPLVVPLSPPIDPMSITTAELDPVYIGSVIAPELVSAVEPKTNPVVDASIALLLLLDKELGDKPLPDDLREISDALHEKIPLSIRDDDTFTTRAEFALTIQRGALFLRAMKDWYDSP